MEQFQSVHGSIQMNIGKEIERVMRQEGRSVSWLAEKLCCDRTNIYKLFRKSSIDTALLMRISVALNHDFFEYCKYCYLGKK